MAFILTVRAPVDGSVSSREAPNEMQDKKKCRISIHECMKIIPLGRWNVKTWVLVPGDPRS